MSLATFKGGVHPFDGKSFAKDKPIKELLLTGDAVYPLSQHIGAPATPVVAIGDHVLAGQKIAEATGFVSSPIISAVSGTVKSIEPRRVQSGAMVSSIIIDNDGLFETIEGIGQKRDYSSLSGQEIVSIIREAGIVGLGGAGFPTHVKLSPKDPSSIRHIIVNGAECEPYLTSDFRLMVEQADRLIEGLEIVLQIFPEAKGVIAIESNKPEAIQSVTNASKGHDRISVLTLKTKYPQGCERMLINAVTGKTFHSAMLPADVGCIVDNVDTMVSIQMAVAESTPLMRRIFTITGDAIAEPGNFAVKIGTSFDEIIAAAGGFKVQPEKLLAGGPMMGPSLFVTNIPVLKTSSALTCFSKDEVAANKQTPCIKCGHCVDVCPEHLIPVFMMAAAESDNLEKFMSLHGMECMECGSCTYTCPSKRPLTQAFKNMRSLGAAKRRADAEKAKAEAEAKAKAEAGKETNE